LILSREMVNLVRIMDGRTNQEKTSQMDWRPQKKNL
jgi:hypothetical protein